MLPTRRRRLKVFAGTTEKAVTENGFTRLKMDLGVDLVEKISSAALTSRVPAPAIIAALDHGMELTPKGVDAMADFVARVETMGLSAARG